MSDITSAPPAPAFSGSPDEGDPRLAMQGLRVEMAAIKAQLGKAEGPWYKKPATWISILALAVSTISTIVSSLRTHDEDIRANRRDVRAIIQRLTKLPIENFELMGRYRDNPNGQALSSLINQENVLLSSQASELIERYPTSFESTEYFAVATALANSNIFGKVPTMYQRAIDSATNANDFVAASRGLGAFFYNQGAHSEAKKHYQNAANVWLKFPERNATIVNLFDFTTYLYWGQAAFGAGQVVESRDYLRKAEEIFARLPPGPFTDQLRKQLDATKAYVSP